MPSPPPLQLTRLHARLSLCIISLNSHLSNCHPFASMSSTLALWSMLRFALSISSKRTSVYKLVLAAYLAAIFKHSMSSRLIALNEGVSFLRPANNPGSASIVRRMSSSLVVNSAKPSNVVSADMMATTALLSQLKTRSRSQSTSTTVSAAGLARSARSMSI